MKRMFTYFEKYRTLDNEPRELLQRFGRIRQYRKGDFFKQEDEPIEKWCFVLEGLVSKEHTNSAGQPVIERICEPGAYFTGTKHAFSKSNEPVAIHFLQHTTLFEIRNQYFQDMVETFPCLKSIYHILTQHKLNHALRHQHTIHALRTEERLHDLYFYRPQLIKLLTVDQKKAFLGITNNREYYKAKRYMEQNLKKSE
ncbi:MAG: Crp/Fnr family transcriptional regulator [Sphingobacterium sp.]|nr:Crp/Fnr family transcriptional regulator [Sphingobacterium sp.]